MKILIAASTMVHIKNFHRSYIEALRKQGNDVFIMASGEEADFNIPFKKKTFSLKNLRLSRKIKKIIKEEKFDIIYLHTTLAAFYVRFALRGVKNRPIVINTVHGYLFSKNSGGMKNRIYLGCERYLKKQTDDIVVMNNEDYEIATENKLCLGNVYKINGMGVRLDGYTPRKSSQNEKINLTFVGEISKRKNQRFLVNALEKLPNATLTLVGDGNERDRIEKLAKKKKVENRLVITGFTKNVKEYLEKTDIYASASKIEGLPFNIIEAMKMELPIVASDIKGHKDLLDNERLFPLDDLDSFVNLVNNTNLENVHYDIEKYELKNVFDANMEIYLKRADN